MALPQNRKGVSEILRFLNPRILGQSYGGFSCNCGAIHTGPAVATKIDPAGGQYPGKEVHWYLWSVWMTPTDTTEKGHGYSVGLNQFVPVETIEALFNTHFSSTSEHSNPYMLEVSGEKRVRFNLPVAVKIMDVSYQTRFCFDWGSDQNAARAILNFFESSQVKFILNSDEGYKSMVNFLSQLNPMVYQGGPEPELPDEPKWLINYKATVKSLRNRAYMHMFYHNCSISGVGTRATINQIDIVFAKV